MAKNEVIIIKDVESKVCFLPVVIRRFFIKTYHNQGGVYIENNKPTYCSDVIKWLEKIEIETTSQKRANKLSWKYFHDKYPQYGKYVAVLIYLVVGRIVVNLTETYDIIDYDIWDMDAESWFKGWTTFFWIIIIPIAVLWYWIDNIIN